MKKIVRLTERDLSRLVRKVVKEQEKPYAFNRPANDWYDANDMKVDDASDFSEEKEFGPDEYKDFMKYINGCNTHWCIKTKKWYDRYQQTGSLNVRK